MEDKCLTEGIRFEKSNIPLNEDVLVDMRDISSSNGMLSTVYKMLN